MTVIRIKWSRVPGITLAIVVMLGLILVTSGCPSTSSSSDDSQGTTAADSDYGADPTEADASKPIRGRLLELDEARKRSRIPIAEPTELPENVSLRQVRLDEGDLDSPTTRVHLIYASDDLPEPQHTGELWDGTKVAYDGGISFEDMTGYSDPVVLLMELMPVEPAPPADTVEVNGATGGFVSGTESADGSKRSFSRLEWWAGGVSYHLFTFGDQDELMKIGTSVPRPAEEVLALKGEAPIMGSLSDLKELNAHPLFQPLGALEPLLTPNNARLRYTFAEYNPEEEVSSIWMIYSGDEVPELRTEIKMDDGSTIPFTDRITYEQLDDFVGGMVMGYVKEDEIPKTAPGNPAVIQNMPAYYRGSFTSPGASRPMPNHIRWHEDGVSLRIHGFIGRGFLVQVGNSFERLKAGANTDEEL